MQVVAIIAVATLLESPPGHWRLLDEFGQPKIQNPRMPSRLVMMLSGFKS